jgi:hypothetical protein
VNPKILVVRDRNHNNESAYDPQFIALELLRRYQTHFIDEPTGGLLASHVAAYDVVWFNNPGHPMGSQVSRDTLQSFPGGVILSGDDLTRGQGFSMEALTGLRHVSNGTSVRCAGNDFPHDNNSAHRYSVTMDPTKFPVSDASHMVFDYGNDIDDSLPNGGVEVMAVAVGGHPSCVAERPVIVRYPK